MSLVSNKQSLNFINKFLVLVFLVCELSVVHCLAQETPPPVNTMEQKIEDRIETVAEETADENADFTELADNLRYFNRNPISLNNTTREELQQLGLLNDIQIENLFTHIKKNGPLLSFEELQTSFE